MADSNTERIDEIVDPKVLQQLSALDVALDKTFDQMVKMLGKTIEVEKSLASIAIKYKDLVDAISKYEAIQRRSNSTQTEQDKILRKQEELRQRISNAYSEESLELVRLQQVMQQITRTRRNLVQEQNAQSGSTVQLRAQLNLLIQSYDAMNAKTKNSLIGKQMLQDIQNLTTEISGLEQSTGRFSRNVGNYQSGFNGLNVSIQQVLREMPALAVSANTFFLAISNNIPMLVDEINRLKAANAALVADGQASIPIGRQILKSLLSWNTAITIGVTLLTLFGGKLVKWIEQLFASNEAIQKNIQSLSELRQAYFKGMQDAQKELVSMKLLYRATQDATLSIQDRKKAVDKLQEQYPNYFGKLKEEAILAGDASFMYTRLANAIVVYAKAQAYQDQVVDYQKNIIDNELRREEITKQRIRYQYELNEAQQVYNKAEEKAKQQADSEGRMLSSQTIKDREKNLSFAEFALNKAKDNLKIVDETIAATDQNIDYLQKKSEDLAGKIDLSELIADPKDKIPNVKKEIDKSLDATKESIQRLEEFRASQVGESIKRIVDDEEASYAVRLDYLDDYISSQKESIDLSAKHQIENLNKKEIGEIAYANNVKLITDKSESEKNKIVEEGAKIRLNINKDYAEELLKQQSDDLSTRQQFIEEDEQEGLLKASAAYKDGLINAEEYAQAKTYISRKASMALYDAEIDSLQKSLDVTGLTEEQKEALTKKLGDARIDYQKYVNETIISDEEKAAEKRLEIEKQLADKRKELISASLELASTLFSANTDKQIAKLDKQSEANSEFYDEEQKKVEQLAEAGAITEEQADARKAYIAEQQEKREADLEEKRKEILQRQAKFEKALAATRVIIDTASAVMKTMALLGPLAAPLIPAIIATGAVQLATILASPIPQYAEGTDNHKGGLAIVGDGGRHEMVITPDGKTYKTPNTNTLIDLPAHSQVLPDYNKAIESLMYKQTIIPIENDKTIIISENKKQIGLAQQNNMLLGKMIKGQNKLSQGIIYTNSLTSSKNLGKA